MKKKVLTFIFVFIAAVSHSQTGAHLTPRRIHVGDRAALILPLPSSDQNKPDILLSEISPGFPSHADIDFHKIILENRTSGGRLIIEFTAFVPGILELPDIVIGDEIFSGLTVTVHSIIDSRSSLTLSGPETSLAMPGTAFFLYGTMAFLIFIILLTIWFFIKGRVFFNTWTKRWKRWRNIVLFKFTEKNLHKALLRGADKRIILDKLSEEFRVFLTFLTGINCRAMTAHEFRKIQSGYLRAKNIQTSFLYNFFKNCDELRFSGEDVSSQEILSLLADLQNFLDILENKRERQAA